MPSGDCHEEDHQQAGNVRRRDARRPVHGPSEPQARPARPSRVVARSSGVEAGKVGIVTGGGSGHLPLFTGYVGEGLLDACAIGNVFEGPTVASCGEAIRLADGGAGVLCLYGNYGGDRMNFDMACEMAELDSIPDQDGSGDRRHRQRPARRERQAARRRRHRLRLQGGGRQGGRTGLPRRRRRGGRRCGGAHPHDRRRAVALPDSDRRAAELRDIGGRDRVRHGHPRRARHLARSRSSRPTNSWTR